MRVAVLVKQIPSPSEFRFADGRLVRDGVRLETNAFCRRANARAVELAGARGEVVVFTMGPPTAEQTVREMIACGASRGVLITDAALAGSDTLITARVLARAIEREGPFDLVLAGANSLDSETGQVGIQVAELLGMPFVGPCRTLAVVGGVAVATIECEGGFADAEVLLPAVASAAERLCAPSKASPQQCASVPGDRIRRLRAADLGVHEQEVGLAGSPTRVGAVRHAPADNERARRMAASAQEFISALEAMLRAESAPRPLPSRPAVPVRADAGAVWCIPNPSSGPVGHGPLPAVADLAHAAGRPVLAAASSTSGLAELADHILWIRGPHAPEDWAAPLAERLARQTPHCVIIEASGWGRELAARIAARLGWGLVGDAVNFTVDDGEIAAWKSAFSGQAMVPITSTSPTLLATVRPGALDSLARVGAPSHPATVHTIRTSSRSRVIYDPPRGIDLDSRELARARRVVVVGSGVAPEDYHALEELRALLGAGPLAATRKVTDRGWLPRTRQIGITGRSVAPDLLISIAVNGGFNHSAGFRNARHVVAINDDPNAEIFQHADIGIIGDWHHIVSQLRHALQCSQVVPTGDPGFASNRD